MTSIQAPAPVAYPGMPWPPGGGPGQPQGQIQRPLAPVYLGLRPIVLRGRVSQARRHRLVSAGGYLQFVRRAQVALLRPRLREFWQEQATRAVMRLEERSGKSLQSKAFAIASTADDLIDHWDDRELAAVLRPGVMMTLMQSWDIWGLMLGQTSTFAITDPAVAHTIAGLEVRAVNIDDDTRAAVRDLLEYGNTQGWGIPDLVRGDPALGIDGLRQTIEMTYRNRDRAVARTELGFAQQQAALDAYGEAGVEKCLVLDGGTPTSDEDCNMLGNGGNGTVVSAEWAAVNRLGHPNCIRCFCPWMGDEEPADPDVVSLE